MRTEWFFANWFIHRDSTLPREPEWLDGDEEAESSSADEDASPSRHRRGKLTRTCHDR